jgi:hypothetical protein
MRGGLSLWHKQFFYYLRQASATSFRPLKLYYRFCFIPVVPPKENRKEPWEYNKSYFTYKA